jgi:hypothetical protein
MDKLIVTTKMVAVCKLELSILQTLVHLIEQAHPNPMPVATLKMPAPLLG